MTEKSEIKKLEAEIIDIPAVSRSGNIRILPEEFIDMVVSTLEQKPEGFALPIDAVNESLGWKVGTDRSNILKKKLNEQYADKLPEGKTLHVGTAAKTTLYKFEYREL